MANERFRGGYHIEDGYAGGSRPQHFSFEEAWLNDDMSDGDLLKLYEEMAEEHFRQTVGICTNRREEFLAWARERMPK